MVGANFLGSAGRKMPSKIEHGNRAAAREYGVDIVLHHYRRHFPFAHEVAQMFEQMESLRRRKTCSGFVHQQKMRLADQGEREGEPRSAALQPTSGAAGRSACFVRSAPPRASLTPGTSTS